MHITRRDFLRGGIAVAALGVVAPSFLVKAAYVADVEAASASGGIGAAPVPNDNVLVVVQLSGGNDGLGTVIPYADPEYYRVRPQLAVPKEQTLQLTDQMGLHPSLKNMHGLYQDGHVAVLQSVGYPNPNRSHFRAMQIWQTAKPDVNEPTGWLGRFLEAEDCEDRACRLRGLNVGNSLPRTLYTESTVVPSIANLQSYQFRADGRFARERQAQIDAIHEICQTSLTPELDDYVRLAALQAFDSADVLQQIAGNYDEHVTYPNNAFAEGLKLIAKVISSNIGARVFYISFGGFDTHAAQAKQHSTLLASLDEGLNAFYKDLDAAGLSEKVMTMTFSEFGRRVAENGSQGTDHGTALPMFVMGGKVKGGFYGNPPDLVNLDNGDIQHQMDFRGVYSSILQDWMGIDPAKVVEGSWPTIDLVTG